MSEEVGANYFDILNHEIRRKILNLLYNRIEMSYTEVLNTLGISDGLLNFHLKKMGDLMSKTPSGTYVLSEKGKRAYELMKEVEKLGSREVVIDVPKLDSDIVVRRIVAFLVDALIFFIFTGVFLDPIMWNLIWEMIGHAEQLFKLHPWIFHWEHLPMVGEVAYRIVAVYSHIFFAVYIFLTLLEAYKGQTPGKFLMKIRIVKIGGLKIGLIESGIRNAGKVFLLPLDLIIGVIFYRKKGFLRFFDYYTDIYTEMVV